MTDEESQPKEGELLPKGELPPWVGDSINRWIEADLKKHELELAADDKAGRAERGFAWVLLIFTLSAIVGLYVTGNRGDAIAVATHALAVFFGFGIAVIRGASRGAGE